MIPEKHIGLYTDHYELTMAQGFFLNGKKDEAANFDYFFRKIPYQGGYVVFAGLRDLLYMLQNVRFDSDACEYLLKLGFHPEFVEYMSGFTFAADVFAPAEGELVFPIEPVMRVSGSLIECQIIETMLLNIINFESLIATKAARIKLAAGDKIGMEFGLRRAQGYGGIQASRAAAIGGFETTSNVLAAFYYGLQPTGTQAHSWIQSFESELEAFRSFAKAFPKKCILLLDTYDTLKSGTPNAIKAAKEMEERGERLFGVRLDSGDLAYLSKKVREKLDDAGLYYVKISASNQLDEHVIKSLNDQEAPIDMFGVGTRLATGGNDSALDGVYKLTMAGGKPRLKISDNIDKVLLPGLKQTYRLFDENDMFYGDVLTLGGDAPEFMYHPVQPGIFTDIRGFHAEPLLKMVMAKGKVMTPEISVKESADYCRQRLNRLPNEHKRFTNPHVYKVGLSKGLLELRDKMIFETREKLKGDD